MSSDTPSLTLSTAEWNSPVIIKLHVNDNDTVRRIPIYRLINENTNPKEFPSYSKLCQYAASYSIKESQTSEKESTTPLLPIKEGEYDVNMTYTDEEGDKIDFSTNEELSDAIRFLQKQIPSNADNFAMLDIDEEEEKENEDDDGIVVKKKNNAVLHVNASVKNKTGYEDSPFLPFFVGKKKKSMKKNQGPNLHEFLEGPNPIFNALDTFFITVASVVEQLKEAGPQEFYNNNYTVKNETCSTNNFDPNFVHNRHACDGCLKSPIVGYRYHSTTIANFDLCDTCMTNCNIPNVEFELAQSRSDQRFRYGNRSYPFWKSPRINNKNTPRASTVSNSRCVNKAVEKAIQQSMDDLKNKNSSIETTLPKECDNDNNIIAEESYEKVTKDVVKVADTTSDSEEEEDTIVVVENTPESKSVHPSDVNNDIAIVSTSDITLVDGESSEAEIDSDEPVEVDASAFDNELEVDDNDSFVSLQNPEDDVSVEFDKYSLEENEGEKKDADSLSSESSGSDWDVVEDDFQ